MLSFVRAFALALMASVGAVSSASPPGPNPVAQACAAIGLVLIAFLLGGWLRLRANEPLVAAMFGGRIQ